MYKNINISLYVHPLKHDNMAQHEMSMNTRKPRERTLDSAITLQKCKKAMYERMSRSSETREKSENMHGLLDYSDNSENRGQPRVRS